MVSWYTVDSIRGGQWCAWMECFTDEGDGEKYETAAEAVTVAEALKVRGYRKHCVTHHWVHRDGVEHTEIVWDA